MTLAANRELAIRLRYSDELVQLGIVFEGIKPGDCLFKEDIVELGLDLDMIELAETLGADIRSSDPNHTGLYADGGTHYPITHRPGPYYNRVLHVYPLNQDHYHGHYFVWSGNGEDQPRQEYFVRSDGTPGFDFKVGIRNQPNLDQIVQ